MRVKHEKGFTLLEVMIFITILSVVLVTSAAFVSKLIYNLKINEHRIYATHYVNEVQEWLASEREADWNNIFSKSTAAGATYCLNNNITFTATLAPLTAGACTGFTGITGITTQPQIYRRELRLVRTSNTLVTATITVSWMEANQTYTEQIESIYTSW